MRPFIWEREQDVPVTVSATRGLPDWPAPENESPLDVARTGGIWRDRAMLPAHGSTVSGAGGRYPSELWGRT
jgi:hypothetical protein